MASHSELKPETKWLADDTETELEMSDDDDFDFDEVAEDDEDEVEPFRAQRKPSAATNVPVWRLIEMSREDRFLKRELADFEDYDSFDNHADGYAGISH